MVSVFTVPSGTNLRMLSSLPRFLPLTSPPTFSSFYTTCLARAQMSSSASVSGSGADLPPLPEKRTVLGVGGLGLDYLATVAAFPNPDDKIRSTSLMVQGGGNAGNALTCAARLGLTSRLISKVAGDALGKSILADLDADGVDNSYIVVSEEGNSPFTYIIVDEQTKTRTCIHTPGYPAMVPEDLSRSTLLSALDGAQLVYSDVRLHETALVIAKEASRMKIPILIDSERKREGLDDLLNLAQYVVCSAKFPEAWTTASSVPSALVSMLLRLPNIKFVIVTLGEDGAVMLERSINEGHELEETDVDSLLESLKQSLDNNSVMPTCISSKSARLSAGGVGTVNGRLLVGTAEKIPPSELIDTTGAGDAFIGAILYGPHICGSFVHWAYPIIPNMLEGHIQWSFYLRRHAGRENVTVCSSSGSCRMQGSRCSDRSAMAHRSTFGYISALVLQLETH